MKTRACLIIVLVILGGVSTDSVSLSQQNAIDSEQRPRFEVSVDMVSLSLAVFDEKRKLVTDLEESDFTVYEDGVEQEIEVFSREDLPLRMVLLLDTSMSMRT